MKDQVSLIFFLAASIIADKSVDQAIRGKHFRRIVCALQLTYEALQQKIIRKNLDEGIKCPKYLHDKIDERRTQYADMFTIYSSIKQDPNFLISWKNAMPVLEVRQWQNTGSASCIWLKFW